MRQSLQYQLWIVAAAGLIFFTHLGATALWDMDEALYTSCAREMFQASNWVVPRFNGEVFVEKPPLMFWTMISGFELFGDGAGRVEFAARFFSPLLGIGTALVAFHLGRILFSARVGLLCGLITASTIVLTVSARAATVDMAITFLTSVIFLCFVVGSGQGEGDCPDLCVSKNGTVPFHGTIVSLSTKFRTGPGQGPGRPLRSTKYRVRSRTRCTPYSVLRTPYSPTPVPHSALPSPGRQPC